MFIYYDACNCSRTHETNVHKTAIKQTTRCLFSTSDITNVHSRAAVQHANVYFE